MKIVDFVVIFAIVTSKIQLKFESDPKTEPFALGYRYYGSQGLPPREVEENIHQEIFRVYIPKSCFFNQISLKNHFFFSRNSKIRTFEISF